MILNLGACSKEALEKMLLDVEQGYRNHLENKSSAQGAEPHEYKMWEALAFAYQENIRRIREAIDAIE